MERHRRRPCIEIANFVMLFLLAKDKHRKFAKSLKCYRIFVNSSTYLPCNKKEEAGVVNIEIYAALGQAPKDMPASGQALKDGCK